ncbi:acyltransferase family protein [Paraburkholderia elongata]|uniref:acyltransferase family protein n=1 Tax=Paraburkholderia elongata TaxID=2675747 RepID=UPI001556AEEF|nr:acyltransferase family protein [Paraburkholderia elongata]
MIRHLTDRKQWVDILKGIGIICVVIGHTIPGYPKAFVYLFHMPLFFFLSGQLFRPGAHAGAYFQKGIRRLLVPYACFLLLFYIPTLVAYVSPITAYNALGLAGRFVFGGPLLFGIEGTFWFATCLFATQQACNILISRPQWKLLACLAALAIAAYANQSFAPHRHVPLALNVTLAAAPLFCIGFALRRFEPRNGCLYLCAAVSLCSMWAATRLPLSWDMKNTNYGIPILSVLVALAWFLLLSRLAKTLSRMPYISRILGSIGRVSLGIMFTHQIVQIALEDLFGISSPWPRCLIALMLSYALSQAFDRFDITRVLLLGGDRRRVPANAPLTDRPVTA